MDIESYILGRASAGGGGSSLPAVTAEDNGDVLTVVNGAWAKAEPSGGGTVVVHVDEETWTLDKTWQELWNALASGKICIVVMPSMNGDAKLAFITTVYPDTHEGVSYYVVNAMLDQGGGYMILVGWFAVATSPDGYPIVDY